MKTIPSLRDALLKTREEGAQYAQPISTIRIDLRQVEQVRFEADSRGGFTVLIDEPVERGGTNSAPSPLHYFVIGAASCFLSQLTKAAIKKNLKVDEIQITARGHVDREKRKFIDIIYDVMLTGSESPENATELLYTAENSCFVHQTLKDAIPVTSKLILNGNSVTSHTLGPKGGS